MTVNDLPSINASLNLLSAILLLRGYVAIKKGEREKHGKIMFAALLSSTAFLTCYLIYHYSVGSVPYPHHNWTRPLYFFILIPHVILAMVMTPFIALGVYHAARKKFESHKRIMRWVWPVWMYVSASGVAVYVMLYWS